MRLRHIILFVALFFLLQVTAVLATSHEHCCDYRGPLSVWYGFHCESLGDECTLDAVTYDLCRDGPGAYQGRERYPAPPNTVTTEIALYYCVEFAQDGTLDSAASALNPCDDFDDCSDATGCYANGDATHDADGDGDPDLCDAGTWRDCTADTHCGSNCCSWEGDCVSCQGSRKVIGIEGKEHVAVVQRVVSFGGRIITFFVSVFE